MNTKNNITIKSAISDGYYILKDKIPKKFKELQFYKIQNITIFDVLMFLIHSENVEYIYISTYRIDTKTAKLLIDLQNKIDIDLKIVVQTNLISLLPSIYKIIKNKLQLNFSDTHGKFAIIKTDKNNYFVSSSANLNSNKQLEQISIYKNISIFEDYKKWFDKFEFSNVNTDEKGRFVKNNKIESPPKGSKNAEKWTIENVSKLADELIEWFKHPENFYAKSFFLERNLYEDLRYYLRDKFPLFSDILKKAKELQEAKLVESGLLQKTNPAMTIFMLKAKHKFKDKIEIEQTTELNIKNQIEKIGKISFKNTTVNEDDI